MGEPRGEVPTIIPDAGPQSVSADSGESTNPAETANPVELPNFVNMSFDQLVQARKEIERLATATFRRTEHGFENGVDNVVHIRKRKDGQWQVSGVYEQNTTQGQRLAQELMEFMYTYCDTREEVDQLVLGVFEELGYRVIE